MTENNFLKKPHFKLVSGSTDYDVYRSLFNYMYMYLHSILEDMLSRESIKLNFSEAQRLRIQEYGSERNKNSKT